MKKFLICLFAILFLIPLTVSAKGKEKVKVYVFEAGGCPYCEKEVEYLESLSSYKKKFTIVRKELYIDHVDWEKGKDYEVGTKVADLFYKAGFTNATATGTPFVVISDLYASTSYNPDLEGLINEAYEKGDADVVGCVEKGKDKCLSEDAKPTEASISNETPTEEAKKDPKKSKTAGIIVLIITAVIVLAIAASSVHYKNEEMELISEIEEKEEDKKTPTAKKTTTKKTAVKKTTKKTSKKK